MEAIKVIAAALALLPLIGVSIAVGRIFTMLLDATARNPSAKDELATRAIIGFALTESIALIAFVVSMIILFK